LVDSEENNNRRWNGRVVGTSEAQFAVAEIEVFEIERSTADSLEDDGDRTSQTFLTESRQDTL
jgi:hypothetical protein